MFASLFGHIRRSISHRAWSWCRGKGPHPRSIDAAKLGSNIHYRSQSPNTGSSPRSLQGPVPFCHLRLFHSRNGKSSNTISPWSSPKATIWNLFDTGPFSPVKVRQIERVSGGYGSSFDTLLAWLRDSNEKISTNRDLPSIHELDVWCDDDGITVFQSLPHFDSGFRS
jgi:hypothetical protein